MSSLTSTVFVVLLVLKIAGVLEITWFWVFFPLWIGLVMVLAFMLFIFIVGFLAALAEEFL